MGPTTPATDWNELIDTIRRNELEPSRTDVRDVRLKPGGELTMSERDGNSRALPHIPRETLA